jgi:hypothetical protein
MRLIHPYRLRRYLWFVKVQLDGAPISPILMATDAEDRATLESDLSAGIGDDVALGRVFWLCPDRSSISATLSTKR